MRIGRRIPLFVLAVVAVVAGACSSSGSSSDAIPIKPGHGEAIFPVADTREVAAMADAVVTYSVVSVQEPDLEADEFISDREGAAPRWATAEITAIHWTPPEGLGERAVAVGDTIVLGAGLVEFRDGKVSGHITSDLQPWLDEGSTFAAAILNYKGSWLMLPATTVLSAGDRLTQLEGQEISQYTIDVVGKGPSELRALLDAALPAEEQTRLRALGQEDRMTALFSDRPQMSIEDEYRVVEGE